MTNPDYFTLTEFQALPDMSAATEPKVLAAAAYFTAIVEREIGEPFIPRSYTQTLDGNGGSTLILTHPFIRSIVSVTVSGVAVDTTGLTAASGILRYATNVGYTGQAWMVGASNVVATYVAGRFATPPADIKDAVMWATRDRLLEQADSAGIDQRKTSVTTDMGTINYILPGEKQPTGYPQLDALISSYLRTTPSLGFA